MDKPEELHSQGISDHAPVRVTFAVRPQRPPQEQPLPRHVCSSPSFSHFLSLLISHSPLYSLPTMARWREYKRLLREAARMSRD
eukprot:8510543-Pyramimonas_sp.AAC.1